MARPTIWEKLRSFILHPSSTTWPGSTLLVTRIVIVAGLFFAIVHACICIAMAYTQLNTRQEVECWDIDNAVDLHHHTLSNKVFGTKTEKLPVTFVNVDVLAGRMEASGPKYLYLRSLEWKSSLVMGLIINPLFLVVFLAWHFYVHLHAIPASHRTAMLFATLSWILFFFENVSITIFNNFPLEQSVVHGKFCWRSDGTMNELAGVGRWAERVRTVGTIVGWLGVGCMVAYSFVTFWVVLSNRHAGDQEPVRLADLSGLATSPRPDQGGNAYSARSARTSPTPTPSAQATANVGPRTGQNPVAPPKPAATRQGQHQRQQRIQQERQQERQQGSELNRLKTEFEKLERQLARPQNGQHSELDRLEREFDRLERQLENELARQFHRQLESEHERQVNDVARQFERHLERQMEEGRTEENVNPFADPGT